MEELIDTWKLKFFRFNTNELALKTNYLTSNKG